MLRPWTFVGFTGHRALPRPELIAPKLHEALQRIAAHTQSPLAALSSAASGGDTLFVEEALARGLPWVLLLPFPREHFLNARDFTPVEQARIAPLLDRAVQVHVEREGQAPGTEVERTEAFRSCSLRTVDDCDYLIAVWDGREGQPGGTADTLAYARQQKRPVVLVDALTGALSEENFPPAAPPPPPGLKPLPLDPRQGGLPSLEATREHYDRMALQHAPEARGLITRVIFLHLLASAVGLSSPIFGILGWLAMLPLVFKIGVLAHAGKLAHRQEHARTQWLRHRLIAELCRAAAGTWSLPVSERILQPVRIAALRDWQRTLQLWRLTAPPAARSLEQQRDEYLHARFDSPETGQIPYFEAQVARARSRHHTWHLVARLSTGLAIACGVAVLAKALFVLLAADAGTAQHYWWADLLKYLSLVLPLVSAAIFTWLSANDCQRRLERGTEMLAQLQAARERIRNATTWSSLERHAAETEAALLLEVLEWHSLSNYTAKAH